LDRVEREHYPDGTLKKEVHYRGTKKHGFWRGWHANGVLAEEFFFEDNLYVNCVTRTWSEQGTLLSEMPFVNGRHLGRMTIWNEDGSIMARWYALERGKVSRAKYDEACKTRPELPRYTEPEEPVVGLRGENEFTRTFLGPAKELLKKVQAAKAASKKPPVPPPSDFDRDFIKQMLSTRKAEALEWLRGSGETSVRNLGEMGEEESLQFVQRLYELGAAKVLAVEIEDFHQVGNDQTTNHLLVQLPMDIPARARLFEFGTRHAESEGFDGESDRGQEYLYFKLC
jgi:hypothetical protein